jgi:DNA-binding beta-propeller fold protein YncE
LHSDRIARNATRRIAFALALAPLFLTACGSTYRPVVSSISPVGPAGQPQKYAVVASTTGATTPGLATLVDFSGDTVVNTTNLGDNPFWLLVDQTSGEGYTLNGDGTLNSFAISASLIQSQVNQSTLPAGSNATTLVTQETSIYATLAGLDSDAQLQSVPPAIKQQLITGPNTVYTVAVGAAPRVYAVVQNGGTSCQAGFAAGPHVAAIETTTQTISACLPTGSTPVYGVMTSDGRRAFIMNKGSNTVTVVNAQTNAIDNFTTYPNGTIPVGTAPVWADFAPTLNEMVVANAGNGTTPGSVSIISIPLCSATTVVSNPSCDVSNPVDATGFGTVVATIPVGVNPVQVAVLQDGSQAVVANYGNPSAGIAGSISIINLATDTVAATIPATTGTDGVADLTVHGNPTYIAVTTGTPTGKVYVVSSGVPTSGVIPTGAVSSGSHDLTVIRTDTDTVETHIGLLSTGVMVHVNLP